MILITAPELLEGEPELIAELFERGLSDLHLRKYDASEQELLDFLKRIPGEYHGRIVLHHHHYLVRSFGVKGVHFNSYTEVGDFPKEDLLFSRPLHNPSAFGDLEESIDRVILSPVHDPLSKTSKRKVLDQEELRKALSEHGSSYECIALGGVTPERIAGLRELGFDGFAVLGGIWNIFREKGREAALERFEEYGSERRVGENG